MVTWKLAPDSGLTSGDSWRFPPRQEAQIPIYRDRDREFRTGDVLGCTFALCDGHEALITPIVEVRILFVAVGEGIIRR